MVELWVSHHVEYDVKVTIDYNKYNEMETEFTHELELKTKTKKYWDPKRYNPFKISTGKTKTMTENEQTQALDFLTENGVLTFDNVHYVTDADKEIVDSGLHKIVLESFFDLQKRLGEPTEVEGYYIYCAPTEMIVEKIKSALDL